MLARTLSLCLLAVLASCNAPPPPEPAPRVEIARVVRDGRPVRAIRPNEHEDGWFHVCANVSADVVELCALVPGRAESCIVPTSAPACIEVRCVELGITFLVSVHARNAAGDRAEDSSFYQCEPERIELL